MNVWRISILIIVLTNFGCVESAPDASTNAFPADAGETTSDGGETSSDAGLPDAIADAHVQRDAADAALNGPLVYGSNTQTVAYGAAATTDSLVCPQDTWINRVIVRGAVTEEQEDPQRYTTGFAIECSPASFDAGEFQVDTSQTASGGTFNTERQINDAEQFDCDSGLVGALAFMRFDSENNFIIREAAVGCGTPAEVDRRTALEQIQYSGFHISGDCEEDARDNGLVCARENIVCPAGTAATELRARVNFRVIEGFEIVCREMLVRSN